MLKSFFLGRSSGAGLSEKSETSNIVTKSSCQSKDTAPVGTFYHATILIASSCPVTATETGSVVPLETVTSEKTKSTKVYETSTKSVSSETAVKTHVSLREHVLER